MARQAPFARARRPAQKQQRRAAVLDAAARLFDTHGVDGTTLTALAQEVGLAKSNLYRYFESREAVLLQLVVSELEAWSVVVAEALRPLRESNDTDRVADAFVAVTAPRHRLAALTVAVPTVLEHNVSEQTIIDHKRNTQPTLAAIVDALSKALPALGGERVGRFFRHFCMHVVGAWPVAHPSEAVNRVQGDPEFAPTCVDFAEVLRDHARLLLRGLATERDVDS